MTVSNFTTWHSTLSLKWASWSLLIDLLIYASVSKMSHFLFTFYILLLEGSHYSTPAHCILAYHLIYFYSFFKSQLACPSPWKPSSICLSLTTLIAIDILPFHDSINHFLFMRLSCKCLSFPLNHKHKHSINYAEWMNELDKLSNSVLAVHPKLQWGSYEVTSSKLNTIPPYLSFLPFHCHSLGQECSAP